MPCDWLCAIHYLTDVSEQTPAFCVVPKSQHSRTLKEAFETLGDDYKEVPLYGSAGTCVLYDTALVRVHWLYLQLRLMLSILCQHTNPVSHAL